MARSKFLQSSFVSGELSPLLKGRVDLDQYYQGMETAENVLIVPQGGLKRRAGTQHVDLAENIIAPFVFSGLGQLFSFNVTTGLPIVGATYTNNSPTFTVLSFTGSSLPYTVYADCPVVPNTPILVVVSPTVERSKSLILATVPPLGILEVNVVNAEYTRLSVPTVLVRVPLAVGLLVPTVLFA